MYHLIAIFSYVCIIIHIMNPFAQPFAKPFAEPLAKPFIQHDGTDQRTRLSHAQGVPHVADVVRKVLRKVVLMDLRQALRKAFDV